MTDPTRGERNHNPGNIEDFGIPWLGLTGHDDGNYCIFDNDFHGIRALALDLCNMQRRHGLRTIAEIIPIFAPSKDRNNVPAYISAVVHGMTCSPNAVLDLTKPTTLRDFTVAIIMHENGRCIFTPQQIITAVNDVLGILPPNP